MQVPLPPQRMLVFICSIEYAMTEGGRQASPDALPMCRSLQAQSPSSYAVDSETACNGELSARQVSDHIILDIQQAEKS